MSEVVVAPDVEAMVMDYLRSLLSVTVASNVPNPRPTSFVRVTEVPFEGFVQPGNYRALLSIEAWHAQRVTASDMARRAAGLLEVPHVEFYAECGSPGFLPDPDSGTPRYIFTAEVYVRGVITS